MTSMTIAHATAFAAEDQPVFEHALALATASGARLFSVNANEAMVGTDHAPSATNTLSRWGRPADSVRHDTMIHSCCEDPVDTLLDALRRIDADLVILGTHQKQRGTRVFAGSYAEALLGNTQTPLIIVPMRATSLVGDDGQFHLRRIVIPAGDVASARAAISKAQWLVEQIDAKDVVLTLVCAAGKKPPDLDLPTEPRWEVEMARTKGSVENSVVEACDESCMIVMATRGTNSIGDALFGTHTEKVMRETNCPLFVVRMP